MSQETKLCQLNRPTERTITFFFSVLYSTPEIPKLSLFLHDLMFNFQIVDLNVFLSIAGLTEIA